MPYETSDFQQYFMLYNANTSSSVEADKPVHLFIEAKKVPNMFRFPKLSGRLVGDY